MTTKDGQTAVVYLGRSNPVLRSPQIPGHPPQPHMGGSKVYVQIEGQPGVIRATETGLTALAATITDRTRFATAIWFGLNATSPVNGLDIILAGQAPDKPTNSATSAATGSSTAARRTPQNAPPRP